MNLAELRGGVMARLTPWDKVPVAAVDIELYNAQLDVLAMVRSLGNKRLDQEAYANVVADQDIYPWPEDAAEIRDVVWLNFGKTPIPMTKIGYREQPQVDWVGLVGSIMPFTYCELPGRRIRLGTKSTDTVTNGLLYRYFPNARHLVKPTDEPSFPEAVHECLVPPAVMRLGSYDGIGLAHPQSFEIYRKYMQERLLLFLQPEGVENASTIQDFDPYYPGGA
jgi:hypothetical protein